MKHSSRTTPRWIAVLAVMLLSCFEVRASRADGMQYPLAVVAAEDGTLYVADRNLPGIWQVKDGQLKLYFKGSKQFRTPLNAVRCLALDGEGRLLAGDSATREVYRFGDEAKPEPLTKGGIGIPMALDVDSHGNIFVADLELKWIFKIPAEGGEAVKFAEVPAPRGLTIDEQDRLWIVSHGSDQLLRMSPDAKVEIVVAGQPFEFPHHVVVDPDGTAYVVDGYAKAVWKVPPGGKPEKLVAGPPLTNPVGLTRRGEHLLVADPHLKQLLQVDSAGQITPLELTAAAE